MLAFLEVLVAMVIEAVPIARVVFVVRVPVLDKEIEAKPTASVLPPFQELEIVKSWPWEEGVTASHSGHFALTFFWGSNGFCQKGVQLPSPPRQTPQVGSPVKKGLLSYGRNQSLAISLSEQTHHRVFFMESSTTQSTAMGLCIGVCFFRPHFVLGLKY